jgi:hypothetical protein
LKDSSFLYDLKKERNEKTNIMDKEKTLATDLNTARIKWEKGMIPPAFWGLGQSEEYKKEKGVMIKN